MDGGFDGKRKGAVDPVLYTAIFLLMRRGEREQAVAKARAELGWDAPEAEAFVDRVWRSHLEEVPPEETSPLPPRPWPSLTTVALAAIRILTGGFPHR